MRVFFTIRVIANIFFSYLAADTKSIKELYLKILTNASNSETFSWGPRKSSWGVCISSANYFAWNNYIFSYVMQNNLCHLYTLFPWRLTRFPTEESRSCLHLSIFWGEPRERERERDNIVQSVHPSIEPANFLRRGYFLRGSWTLMTMCVENYQILYYMILIVNI